ncbi:MAG: hypothetical protein FD163_2508 [Hyphomonadaceae bacterium]|nr:MAG: hypothetical protein FD128_1596 [Hyphomonadaceae bacterium]KAF0182718.1 MAG: hypothetical protein FD163_2508 [Hyphomonadaceae bacterium]
MTKIREPMTPYWALNEIAKLIGWDGCADVVGKSESQLRKLGDHDTGRGLHFQDAIRLDAAFQKAGGNGAPLFECYAAKLGVAAAQSDDENLIEVISSAIGECGEAFEAALKAIGDSKNNKRALKEVGEAVGAVIKVQQLMEGRK